MGSVANHLKMADQQRIHALLELGWSHRRVAREAGVDRETVARYARAGPSSPANLIVGKNPSTSGPRSPAADRDADIRQGVKQGLSAQRIWQDLVEQYGYTHGYLTTGQPAARPSAVLLHRRVGKLTGLDGGLDVRPRPPAAGAFELTRGGGPRMRNPPHSTLERSLVDPWGTGLHSRTAQPEARRASGHRDGPRRRVPDRRIAPPWQVSIGE
jgi:hypothetical protein